MKININDMIIYKGGDPDLEYGIAMAYLDHINGNETRTPDEPISVRYIREEKRFLVVDGLHRIVKGLLEGAKDFNCKFDWENRYTKIWIPPKENRFVLDDYLTKGDNRE